MKSPNFVDPATLTSIYTAISNILKEIPLLGNLFKGSTPHIDYDTCVAKSNEVAQASIKFYDAMDEEGKRLFEQYASNYYLNYVLAGFGSWWDGIIRTDYESWNSKGWTANQREICLAYLRQPVFYFLRFEDSGRVQETFTERYTNRLNQMLWTPLSAYAKTKYNSSLEDIVKNNETSSTGTFKYWWVIGLAVAGGLAYYFFKKS
jgi:hypothetical protein